MGHLDISKLNKKSKKELSECLDNVCVDTKRVYETCCNFIDDLSCKQLCDRDFLMFGIKLTKLIYDSQVLRTVMNTTFDYLTLNKQSEGNNE